MLSASATVRIALLLVAGLALRLVLSPFGSFQADVETFRVWATVLTAVPHGDFYSSLPASDRLPGELWLIWIVAEIHGLFSSSPAFEGDGFVFLFKLVAGLADVGVAAFIFLIVRRVRGESAGLLGAALYLFNPAVIFLSAIWGQWDSVGLVFALLSLWLLIRRSDQFAVSALVGAILVHAASMVLVPIFALALIRRHALGPISRISSPSPDEANSRASGAMGWRRPAIQSVVTAIGLSVIAIVLIAFPFDVRFWPFAHDVELFALLEHSLGALGYTTLLAFNFWALRDRPSGSNFQLDSPDWFLGLSPHTLGYLLFAAAAIVILIRLWRAFDDRAVIWASFAILLSAYILPTRVHERDLLPAVALAALAAALSIQWRWLLLALSATFLLNLYWAYDLYYDAPNLPLIDSSGVVLLLTLVNLAIFAVALLAGLPLLQGQGVPTRYSFAALLAAARPPAVDSPPVQPTATPTASAPVRGRHPRPPTVIAVESKEEESALDARTLPIAWSRFAAPALLFVLALTLYAVRLGSAETYSYDEVYHAFTAAQYVDGNADAYVWFTTVPEPKANPNLAYEWTHPPVGKLLIAAGIAVFDDDPVGWRVATALFGALGIVVAYYIGRQLSGRATVGVLTAVLLLADGLYFVESRTGMVDIFLVVFLMAALLFFSQYLAAAPDAVRNPLLLTGLFMGLAIATKWNGVYASALIGLVAVVKLGSYWRAVSGRRPKAADVRAFRAHILWVPLGLIVLPAGIYLLSYLPFFFKGHSVSELRELQRQMYYYHTNLEATHTYASSWWEWPLAKIPVWFYGAGDADSVARVYANGNPFLYWAMVPAVLYVSWRWWSAGRLAALGILLIGFFGQWLPWALSPRISFVYHFLPAVPFGAVAVATVLGDLWRSARRWQWAAARVYVAVVVGAFVFFYPIYSAVSLTNDRFDMRIWFDSWR